MAHDDNHGPADYNKAFAFGVALNLGYIAVEATFGILVGSLALLADAGHNLSDVLGLLLAWAGNYLGQRKPTERFTYGWRKSSILAALMNAIILLVTMGGIAWEAIRRVNHTSPVAGKTIIVVAAVGVVINTATALLFLSGRKSDLNIRGAFLHMAADAGISAGVVVAGVVIIATGWFWIDPVVSLLISVIIVIGTWGLLRDSFNLVLDAVPAGIDPEAVKAYLSGLPGVAEVHDLHIWAMSTTETALTVHLVKANSANDDLLLENVDKELHARFGIGHSTIQWERQHELSQCGTAYEIDQNQ